MTDPYVIVGSGPAAVGVALALRGRGIRDVLVLDIGGRLEPDKQELVSSMGRREPVDWAAAEIEAISRQPVAVSKQGLPQKRAYASDFPFRDLGQLGGFEYVADANSSPVSSAYGGFSNVWGAQVMPFSRSTFDTWPITFDEMAPHYTAAFEEIPLAGEEDDLLDTFPLLTDRAQPLPPVAPRTEAVLDQYRQNRSALRDAGVTVGRARLALRASDCRRINLCMTGCPYGLIWSASQTFDKLRSDDAVRYESGVLATAVGEGPSGPFVRVKSLVDGTCSTLRASRVFVACGGIGSTRLILGSLADPPRRLEMGESIQFALPFLSRRSAGDPRQQRTFTLNQFNILLSFDDSDYHTSQLHCYPYNPAVLAALPAPLRMPLASRVTGEFLSRLTIALGYLPSWAAPTVPITLTRRSADNLPDLVIGSSDAVSQPLMLKQVMRRLRAVGRHLDLHPVAAAMRVAPTAKSYHFGGSFPHRANPTSDLAASDILGRVSPWRRIHIVDGAVLPSVPSTTFTLTVVANAHRIATAVAAEAEPTE